MPTLITHVSIDLDELFENGAATSDTFCGEAGRVVEVTVNIAFVLVV